MRLAKLVPHPHDCQGAIEDFLRDRRFEADVEPSRGFEEPWLGSIIQCECGKWYRYESFQLERDFAWVHFTPTAGELLELGPVASPGRTRL